MALFERKVSRLRPAPYYTVQVQVPAGYWINKGKRANLEQAEKLANYWLHFKPINKRCCRTSRARILYNDINGSYVDVRVRSTLEVEHKEFVDVSSKTS